MNKLSVVSFVLLAVVGGVVVVWVLNSPGSAPKIGNAALESAANEPEKPGDPRGGAELADEKMAGLKSADERLAHLDWIAAQDWATSNMPVLRKAIMTDPDETVQVKAVEVALALAGKEGQGATSAVVKTALASSKGNTRARGLKAAREHPDASLVPALIELVDGNDAYATMALNALAYTPDERAKAKITAVAKDESVKPQVRQRAVALIAVTRDDEGHQYLVELSKGTDETMAKIAIEVLKAWNK